MLDLRVSRPPSKARTRFAPWWVVVLGACVSQEPSPTADRERPDRVERRGPSETRPEGTVSSSPPPVPPQRARAEKAALALPSGVSWFDGPLDAALSSALVNGKSVFLDFGAYWCPPCQQMEKVFADPLVGAYVGEHHVALRVDADADAGEALVQKFRVQALPTLIVVDGHGREQGRLVDAVTPPRLVEALERIARGEEVLLELEAAVEHDGDDLEARYALGHAYALAARWEEAEAQYAVLELADPRNELGWVGKVMFDRALFFQFKLDHDPAGAQTTLEQLIERFPDSPEVLRARKQVARMQHAQGHDDAAQRSLEHLLQEGETPRGAHAVGWFSFRERFRPGWGRSVVEGALERHPRDAELHYLRAELLALEGQRQAAADAMHRASALDPQSTFYRGQVARFEGTDGP